MYLLFLNMDKLYSYYSVLHQWRYGNQSHDYQWATLKKRTQDSTRNSWYNNNKHKTHQNSEHVLEIYCISRQKHNLDILANHSSRASRGRIGFITDLQWGHVMYSCKSPATHLIAWQAVQATKYHRFVLLTLSEGNPQVMRIFYSKKAGHAERVPISWRHHVDGRASRPQWWAVSACFRISSSPSTMLWAQLTHRPAKIGFNLNIRRAVRIHEIP